MREPIGASNAVRGWCRVIVDTPQPITPGGEVTFREDPATNCIQVVRQIRRGPIEMVRDGVGDGDGSRIFLGNDRASRPGDTEERLPGQVGCHRRHPHS
jgi:hypothetical protein